MSHHTVMLLVLRLAAAACLGAAATAHADATERTLYTLDTQASGVIEKVDNLVNLTVVSTDANDLKAEYHAGFVQGRLQGHTIVSARDNDWDGAYLTDPSHAFPKQPGPTAAELQRATRLLADNYGAFLQYLRDPATDAQVAYRLKRLLFRMLGIYHGANFERPGELDFSGSWLPDAGYLKAEELILGYETAAPTFMDVYFLNAYSDLMDLIAFAPQTLPPVARPVNHPDKCSAFVKRSGPEVILTHNSWMSFLAQTMYVTLVVNTDRVTMNAATPGLIGSATDFGYNGKGIMFNETTHRLSHTQVKADGLLIFWRAALAEQFAGSLDEFFRYISLDNTGTYLNGYMLVDTNTNETGLVEMSYRCFVYYRSHGGSYKVSSKSLDGLACPTDYDEEMVRPDYLMGINYPASLQVRKDLQSTDNRPARRRQFQRLLPLVTDLERAKSVIVFTEPGNPLSIFGRWDLGYGETDYPKQIPDGAVDAKAADTGMVRAFMHLTGSLDLKSAATGAWMLYGTARVQDEPFVWSSSSWKWQKLRDVPDRVDGRFTLMPLYLR